MRNMKVLVNSDNTIAKDTSLTRFVAGEVRRVLSRFDTRLTRVEVHLSDINNLLSRGYITVTTRPNNDPSRYAICPVIEDPTDGGIALDQFLAITRKPDGTPVEPRFLENFESLRTTGDWAD